MLLVNAWVAVHWVPLIFCKAGEREHWTAEACLETHSRASGAPLVLVAKRLASVWKVDRSARGRDDED